MLTFVGHSVCVVKQKVDMGSNTIWLAEDDPDDLEIYTEILDDLGISGLIRTFRDGAEVIEALTALSDPLPKILVLDSRMPVMGGIDVVKALKTREFQDILQIHILANVISPHEQSQADELGVPILIKPTSMAMFTKLFKQILENAAVLSSVKIPPSQSIP